MKLSRRLFATLILTVAPFVGVTPYIAAKTLVEPDIMPKEVDIDEIIWECHEPADLILAQCLGQKHRVLFPKDAVWINGLGWSNTYRQTNWVNGERIYTETPSECIARLEQSFQCSGLKAVNYWQPIVELPKYVPPTPTENASQSSMVPVDSVKTRRSFWMHTDKKVLHPGWIKS